MIDSSALLERLGYEYYSIEAPPSRPSVTDIKFSDLIPALKGSDLEIAEKHVYSHQLMTLRSLKEGKNVVLRSGTGSGKTEAWFLYAGGERVKTLVIYPTLALSNDQVRRLRSYCEVIGLNVLLIDAPSKTELLRGRSYRQLLVSIESADLILTNPAFLLSEIKRLDSGKGPLLGRVLDELSLIVVDDFDFYSPRSIALLFFMLTVIRERSPRVPKFVLMTAMLENPEDVASFLTSINGLETEMIDGEPFRPPSRTYVVLGKDLRRIWRLIKERTVELRKAEIGKDVKDALEDYELFKRNYFKVIEVARNAGIDVPTELSDPIEILRNYAEDDHVTLVFTRSISKAEEVARRLGELVGKDKVAAHHHLLSKRLRQEIEERTRRGEVKILISPRTLSQGIDIGEIGRVVHLGLPQSLREYYQREGRIGRRERYEFVESIVIPLGQWDRDLLVRGVEALSGWLSLPKEKLLINPHNRYFLLAKALYHYVNPKRRSLTTKDELELLSKLRLVRDGELTDAGKRVWMKLNFYEFAPPFGIKRYRIGRDGSESMLEEVSHADLVEKFQIGCIDYTSDGIVTGHRTAKSGSRTVTGIVVEDISESVMMKYDHLSYVLEDYYAIKKRWGEQPSIRRDYFAGRIHSEVNCVVRVPNGFGEYVKVPDRVIWTVLSDRTKIYVVGDRTVVSRDGRSILVPTVTRGYYSDYTYGVLVEVDPRLDPDCLRLGLAFIRLVMRRKLGIAIDSLEGDVAVVSDRKFVSIHETECAGLLEVMDWLKLKEIVESYEPDGLDEYLLESINDLAYSTFVSRRLDWNVARHYAVSILEHLLLRERVKVALAKGTAYLPRPSRAHRRATLAAYMLPIDEANGTYLYCLATFDGERYRIPIGIKTLEGPDDAIVESVSVLASLIDGGFKLYVYDREQLRKFVEDVGSRALRVTMIGAESIGSIAELKTDVAVITGTELPYEEAESAIGLPRQRSAAEIAAELSRNRQLLSLGWSPRDVLVKIGPVMEEVIKMDLYNLYVMSFAVEEELKGRRLVEGSRI